MSAVGAMLTGMMGASCAVAALFFFKFWRKTHDTLFLMFAGAFLLMACHWVARGVAHVATEAEPYFYLVRLAAFVLILLAILQKNRRR